jgi:hypothetical protein
VAAGLAFASVDPMQYWPAVLAGIAGQLKHRARPWFLVHMGEPEFGRAFF